MKKLILILIILIVGFFVKDNYFTLNLKDTYFVISYLYIALFLALIMIVITLIKRKKINNH